MRSGGGLDRVSNPMPGRAPLTEVLLKHGWLLPFVWLLAERRVVSNVREVAEALECPRRLAASGLYYMARMGLVEKLGEGFMFKGELRGVKVRRLGRWFACVVGETVIVAKVLKRRIHLILKHLLIMIYYLNYKKTLMKMNLLFMMM
jgi:hypothetical protein